MYLGTTLFLSYISRFLQLNWTFPASDQAGQYQFDIRGITEKGHMVSFSRSLEVKTSTVYIEDVVSIDRVSSLRFAQVFLYESREYQLQSQLYLLYWVFLNH